MKNRSYIVSSTSIPISSPYSEKDQRFKKDVESLSLLEKDAQLFYSLITRRLFTNKIARLDIQYLNANISTTSNNLNIL